MYIEPSQQKVCGICKETKPTIIEAINPSENKTPRTFTAQNHVCVLLETHILPAQKGCSKSTAQLGNWPYLQSLTPDLWVVFNQPLGHNILGTAAQEVHAVFKVNFVLTLHRMDFNFKRENRTEIAPD